MDGFETFTRRLSNFFSNVALVALVLMTALVAVDIVCAKVFKKPIDAAMDLTALLALAAIAYSTAQTQIEKRHIKVEFVSTLLPKGLRKIIRLFSTTLCVLFFMTVLWRLVVTAQNMRMNNEASMTAQIPLAPFAYAMALSLLPMVLALLLELREIAKRRS